MTKAIALIALTCVLVAGAAVSSILGRDSVPAARADMASVIVKNPVANRESKQDKLAVTRLALADKTVLNHRRFLAGQPLLDAYRCAAATA